MRIIDIQAELDKIYGDECLIKVHSGLSDDILQCIIDQSTHNTTQMVAFMLKHVQDRIIQEITNPVRMADRLDKRTGGMAG